MIFLFFGFCNFWLPSGDYNVTATYSVTISYTKKVASKLVVLENSHKYKPTPGNNIVRYSKALLK